MSSLPQSDSSITNVVGVIGEPAPDAASSNYRNGRRRLRSLTGPVASRPSRVDLERACRIALMESEAPATVEVIYDRIVRRGSVMFFAYKRPFRAIVSALSALEKGGEVVVHVQAGGSILTRRGRQRFWQRAAS